MSHFHSHPSVPSFAGPLSFESLEQRCVLSNVSELLFDVNAVSSSKDSVISSFTEMNGAAYFVMGTTGARTLWKSDGTAEGTSSVRSFANIESLTNVNGSLYFSASDSFEDMELWRSDGTYAGTSELKEIRSNWYSSGPLNLLNVNGTLYFTANDGTRGYELWRSDGTTVGTKLVEDIRAGAYSSAMTPKASLGDLLVFMANDGVTGSALWRSDGTDAGTFLLTDFVPGNAYSNPLYFTEMNGALYFSVDSAQGEAELWRTDGTATGTWRVKDVNPNGSDEARELVNVGGVLYFTANDGVAGVELWKSDGTEDGTQLVADIIVSSDGGLGRLVNVSGQLLFSANDGISGHGLWKSDGTPEGTTRIVANLFDNDGIQNSAFVNAGGVLYFHTANSAVGRELWRSDGTAEGTRLVKNIWQGSWSSSPALLTPFGDRLLFMANDGVHGIEPWISDGSESGTTLVKNVSQGTQSSDPTTPVNVNGVHYFAANDGVHGAELWRTDGTAAGTRLVKDVRPGVFGSAPRYLTNVNGTLYFVANDGAHSFEVWRSDGTPEGTALLKDVNSQLTNNNPAHLTNVNGVLYFSAFDGVSGLEPWRSDGTTEGTVVINVNPTSWSTPSSFVAFNSDAYFLAYSPTGLGGKEIWKIADDAPPARLRAPESYLNSVEQLLPVGNQLFFTRFSDELWTTDGTEAGTRLVKTVRYGGVGLATSLTECNGILYFVATTNQHGGELWRSDGTEAGTYLVRDVRVGAEGSEPRHLINVNGTLYFAADDGIHGVELWKSDGTADGTLLAQDFTAGAVHSYPFGQGQQPIAAIIGDWLYFVTGPTYPGTVPSIHRVHGQTGEVELVTDARLGVGNNAYPQWLANLNGDLGLSAAVPGAVSYGAELRVLRAPVLQSAGDYSSDGVVDGADFLAWQRAYASFAAALGHGADGSANGFVNDNDLAVWIDHFGETIIPPAAALTPAATAPTSSIKSVAAALDAAFAAVANEPIPLGAAAIALRQATEVNDLDRPARHIDRTAIFNEPLVHRATTAETVSTRRPVPPTDNAKLASRTDVAQSASSPAVSNSPAQHGIKDPISEDDRPSGGPSAVVPPVIVR